MRGIFHGLVGLLKSLRQRDFYAVHCISWQEWSFGRTNHGDPFDDVNRIEVPVDCPLRPSALDRVWRRPLVPQAALTL